jgi:hypothetical protein
MPKTREYIDAIVKEVSAQDLRIKFVLKDGLPVAAPPQATAPKKPETQATFKDDPLIREALEIFKGEIKTAGD